MDFGFYEDLLEEDKTAEKPAAADASGAYRNIWVVAETAGGVLHAATREAMGPARELADQIGVYVYGVLLAAEDEGLSAELIALGADRVLASRDPAYAEYQPEIYAGALAELVDRYRPEIVLLPATYMGNDLAPKLAQRLGTGLISHCIRLELDMAERLLLGTVPVLGGEVYHTLACAETHPQMATVQPGYFPAPAADAHRSGSVQEVEVEALASASSAGRLTWLELDVPVELPAIPLPRARIVVSAGRGMGDAEGFALVKELAEALRPKGPGSADGEVAVAGSRGAFDEGWIGEEQVVGVGGTSIAPDLYIACGLSGDVYHYFGVQDAKFVVAINPDPAAPIMKLANMAVVGDGPAVLRAMLQELRA